MLNSFQHLESFFWGQEETSLGFAPRSESFAFEPSVQVSAISSLSGLTSCRPSANLPNSFRGVSLLNTPNKKEVLKSTSFLFGHEETVLTCSHKTCLRVLLQDFIFCKNSSHSAHRSLELQIGASHLTRYKD